MKATYALELDGDGRRFWLCEHEDGSVEPMPPGWALTLNAERGEPSSTLPIGTKVIVEVPDRKESALEEARLVRERMRDQLLERGFPPDRVNAAIEALLAEVKK